MNSKFREVTHIVSVPLILTLFYSPIAIWYTVVFSFCELLPSSVQNRIYYNFSLVAFLHFSNQLLVSNLIFRVICVMFMLFLFSGYEWGDINDAVLQVSFWEKSPTRSWPNWRGTTSSSFRIIRSFLNHPSTNRKTCVIQDSHSPTNSLWKKRSLMNKTNK